MTDSATGLKERERKGLEKKKRRTNKGLRDGRLKKTKDGTLVTFYHDLAFISLLSIRRVCWRTLTSNVDDVSPLALMDGVDNFWEPFGRLSSSKPSG